MYTYFLNHHQQAPQKAKNKCWILSITFSIGTQTTRTHTDMDPAELFDDVLGAERAAFDAGVSAAKADVDASAQSYESGMETG